MNKVLLIIGIFTLLTTTGVAEDKGINKAIQELEGIGQEHRSKEWFRKAEAAKEKVILALKAARKAPDMAHNLGHITSYYYVPNDMYAVYTKTLLVTDINLEVGEEIAGEVHIGDAARWSIAVGTTGTGPGVTQHIYIKPHQERLLTNLIIPTNRRTYMIELSSTKSFYMPSVKWDYQKSITGLFKPAEKEIMAPATIANVAPENLYFGYEMRRRDRKKSWAPLRIFDDGQKTYVVFDEEMRHRDTPVIYAKTDSGDLALVNFRVNMPYYIIDGLMDEIILKRGHKSKDEIKITRKNRVG